MNEASAPLLGLHDFAAFCKQREGATTVRTLLDLAWTRDAAGVAVGRVRADAFCHNMVRSLVGCLLAVGEGRRPPSWAGVDPAPPGCATRRSPSLPAHGLTLEEVAYPPDDELGRPGARPQREAAVNDDHYFTADPAAPFKRAPVPASVWGHELALTSGSGVFAAGPPRHRHRRPVPRDRAAAAGARILDLGCGYGVIGLALRRRPGSRTVTAVDVNERAVLLANENAAALGRGRTGSPRCRRTQVPPDATYDEIWSNPPIRIGKDRAPRAAADLAAAAGARTGGR